MAFVVRAFVVDVFGPTFGPRGDSAFSRAVSVAERFRRLQVLHESRDLLQCYFGEWFALETSLFSDVPLVDRVSQMVVGFHQGGPGEHEEPCEVSRVESPETFRHVSRRPANCLFELQAQMPVPAERTA